MPWYLHAAGFLPDPTTLPALQRRAAQARIESIETDICSSFERLVHEIYLKYGAEALNSASVVTTYSGSRSILPTEQSIREHLTDLQNPPAPHPTIAAINLAEPTGSLSGPPPPHPDALQPGQPGQPDHESNPSLLPANIESSPPSTSDPASLQAPEVEAETTHPANEAAAVKQAHAAEKPARRTFRGSKG